MINTTNLQKAKNEINKAKPPITVLAQSLEFNRKMLEYGKFQTLLDIHSTKGYDKPKQLDSGLNHIMARIATKNKVSIGIDLNKIRGLPPKEKAKTIGRIKQNIKICRKAKCAITLLNYKDKKDASEFLISLGASTPQVKEAL